MKISLKMTLIAVFVSALGLGGLTRATYASESPHPLVVTPQPQHSNELGEAGNLTRQQSILSRLSRMNLSSDQEAQLQQVKQPLTFQVIKPILTSGQDQMWLQMRRAEFGGR